MALTVQNLRAVGTGVEPASLLPGQICFNITDKVLYVGDGSSVKTSFDGTQAPGVAGEGWYAMPMDFASLGDYYVANPLYYGDTPTDQQVLTWSTALNHPIWTSGGGGGGGGQVYVVTNAAVAAAPGTTTSDKITAAIGVASPDEGDTTIVTGLPDDVYEGLYFFTTQWVKGANEVMAKSGQAWEASGVGSPCVVDIGAYAYRMWYSALDANLAPGIGYAFPSSSGTNYTTIQAAINAAAASDNIYVHPGRYVEQLTINQNNLIVRGAVGTAADKAARPIIQYTAGSPVITNSPE